MEHFREVRKGSTMSVNQASVISISKLSLEFAGREPGRRVEVLRDVSFDVHAGELICLVGPSGCGKSSLLNVLGGFQVPSSGDVRVHGQPLRGPDPRRIFVFQENSVFPWLTVAQNIAFGIGGLPVPKRAEIVSHYVDMVGLEGFESAYPWQLSGGMRQRVEIARALAASPDVLYMDEPFSALDFFTRLKMREDLVRIWQRERKTILFVTHDIDEAVQLADRVVVLSSRPTTIRDIVEVRLPRPRDMGSAGYLAARERIFTTMGIGTQPAVLSEDAFAPQSRRIARAAGAA
jgi:NitT/TauT family transport system ATP-binding protein